MIKKNLVKIGFTCALSLTILAGCGSNAGSATTSTPSSDQTTAAPAATPDAKPVTVSMVFSATLFGNVQDDLIKQFQTQYPNITVKAESVPDGSVYNTLRTRIASGDMPDVYQMSLGDLTTGLEDKAGFIYDLKDMGAVKNYAAGVVESSKVNGKVADLSLGVAVLGLSYNKKMLADAGYNGPFKTWEDLIAAGKKLKSQGKDLLVYSKSGTFLPNVFQWVFAQAALKDPEFKKAYLSNTIDWTKPGYKDILTEGFNKFKELNQYVRVGSFTMESATAQQSFTSGDSAMMVGGTWEAGVLHGLNKNLDLGFMSMPYTTDNQSPYIVTNEDGIAINAKSANLEAAKTFVNWLYSKENYGKILKAKGSMSVMPGVGELDPAYTDVPNWLGTDRVMPFANVGPVPGPTWTQLGKSAQQYTFDNKLDAAENQFIDAYNKSKAQQ